MKFAFLAYSAVALLATGSLQAQTFSVAPGGGSGLPPNDIFLPGLMLALPGTGPGAYDVNAISFGRPAGSFSVATPLLFSVSPGSAGVPGSAVAFEAAGGAGGPGDHPADIFLEVPGSPATNALVIDGDGVANPGAAPGLGLIEPIGFPGDNLDAWDSSPFPGPFSTIWFSYSGLIPPPPPAVPGEIWMTILPPGGPYDSIPPAVLYAAAGALGLDTLGPGTDDLDALVVFEDGAPGFGAGDIVLFSLTPGSASLGIGSGTFFAGMSAADIFSVTGAGPGSLAVHRTAAGLGLLPGDDVDALDVVPEPGIIGLALCGVLALNLRRRNQAA